MIEPLSRRLTAVRTAAEAVAGTLISPDSIDVRTMLDDAALADDHPDRALADIALAAVALAAAVTLYAAHDDLDAALDLIRRAARRSATP